MNLLSEDRLYIWHIDLKAFYKVVGAGFFVFAGFAYFSVNVKNVREAVSIKKHSMTKLTLVSSQSSFLPFKNIISTGKDSLDLIVSLG